MDCAWIFGRRSHPHGGAEGARAADMRRRRSFESPSTQHGARTRAASKNQEREKDQISIPKNHFQQPAKEEEKERELIYVPILHTTSDMGTLADSMQERYIKKFGKTKWREHVQGIGEMWKEIRRKIRRLKLSYEKVKVYQDGLPICDKEKEIIAELAKKGSPNHKLVQWMMRQGATLVGTEEPKLLVREYNHLRRIMNSKRHQEREKLIHEFKKESQELLLERDKRIGEQIDATLKQGETGVLFIGLLHRVDEMLPSDVKVHYLIHRLPFRRSFEAE